MPSRLKTRFPEWKSCAHRVVHGASSMASVVITDGSTQNCWALMPQELLTEIILKIEVSEDTWPQRKNVVACAGVCRSWRQVTKETVKIPQFSSKITFPIAVKQPGPRENLLQCFIKRNRSAQTYHLYLSLSALVDDGKFLLCARKCRHATGTDYIISLDANDMSDGSNSIVGKLKSNFVGTKFTIYDAHLPHAGAKVTKSPSTRLAIRKQVPPKVSTCYHRVAHISYELNVLGARGPRKMHCVMDFIPASAIEPEGIAPIQTEFSRSTCVENTESELLGDQNDGVLVLKNKSPRWHEPLHCWCLNFHGRVTIASVKNFQLVASSENEPDKPEHDEIILQFGKVGKDLFTMDYRYPISAFQAFAICLSSFDTKIACE